VTFEVTAVMEMTEFVLGYDAVISRRCQQFIQECGCRDDLLDLYLGGNSSRTPGWVFGLKSE
jgi:hypothetical protein